MQKYIVELSFIDVCCSVPLLLEILVKLDETVLNLCHAIIRYINKDCLQKQKSAQKFFDFLVLAKMIL